MLGAWGICQVEELVEDAKASGARVVAGGNRFSPNGKNGYFYEPTILADVQEGVRIVDEEQFGPVMPLIKYSDVDDALVSARHSLLLADSLLAGTVALHVPSALYVHPCPCGVWCTRTLGAADALRGVASPC